MMIDIHTHTFPEKLAPRVLDKLSKSADIMYYVEGTVSALSKSMAEAGITHSVILPVVTAPAQHETVNQTAVALNDRAAETGIFSFGGIHPDNGNYREILRSLAAHGIRGIKLHPVYQDTCFDDIRYLRILDCAFENGLVAVVHAGYDVGYPGKRQAAPEHILPVLRQIQPGRLVLAHMGGWGCWDEVEEMLLDYPVWLDTSFTLTPQRRQRGDGVVVDESQELSGRQFCRMVRRLGADRVLFGTDSPWTQQAESVQAVAESGLNPDELQKIFYDNAADLLQLQTAWNGAERPGVG